jgi:hypothetical protein
VGIVWQLANAWEAPHRENNKARRVTPAGPKRALTRALQIEIASVLLLPSKFDTPTAAYFSAIFSQNREIGRQLKMNVRKAHRGEELQGVPNGRQLSNEKDLNYEPGGSAG